MIDPRPCNEKWTTGPHPSQGHACKREVGHPLFPDGSDHVCRCGARTHVHA